MREYVVENEFVKAVKKAGGVAYKLTSQTTNGLPDRLVLFFPAKTVFVELKAPGRVLRPLQRKRRYQLQKLGFPVADCHPKRPPVPYYPASVSHIIRPAINHYSTVLLT